MENLKKLYYGSAYYPELWDKDTLEEDIYHMKKLGINVVRVGEFAWSRMEPKEGELNAGYFAEVIAHLNDHGIKTIMCTPTATPPIWMSHGHSERCFKNQAGEVLSHGARQHICTDNSYFRERTRIVVEEIAKKISGLEGLIGWQLDNELKCHVAECYCDNCKELWHHWLEEKYKTIDNLNRLWGTDIWSECYLDFSQVPMPVKTPFIHNASLVLAFKRFSREKATEFLNMQAAVIRKYSDKPITHNTGEYFNVDNPALYKNLDFASFDDYAEAEDYNIMLRSYDYFRTIKPNTPFWVMETSPNHNGCLLGVAKPHPKGYLKAEAASAYLSGAEGFFYWLFRQQKSGCEMPHGSILYAWGKPTTGYEDVLEAGKWKDKLEPYIMDSKLPKGQIALMYSDNARIQLETEPLEEMDYWKLIQRVYEEEIPEHITTDLIHENTNLDGYTILYTPYMVSLTDEFIKKATDYVEQGGIWIAGPMCNYRTKEHTVPLDGGWGKLEKIAGASVKYMVSFSKSNITGEAFGKEVPLSMVGCVFEIENASPLGKITSKELKDEIFMTETTVGEGRILLLGAYPEKPSENTFMKDILKGILQDKGLIPQWNTTPGIITRKRVAENGQIYLFATDMVGAGGDLTIGTPFKTEIGEFEENRIRIKPFETVLAIIQC